MSKFKAGDRVAAYTHLGRRLGAITTPENVFGCYGVKFDTGVFLMVPEKAIRKLKVSSIYISSIDLARLRKDGSLFAALSTYKVSPDDAQLVKLKESK